MSSWARLRAMLRTAPVLHHLQDFEQQLIRYAELCFHVIHLVGQVGQLCKSQLFERGLVLFAVSDELEE